MSVLSILSEESTRSSGSGGKFGGRGIEDRGNGGRGITNPMGSSGTLGLGLTVNSTSFIDYSHSGTSNNSHSGTSVTSSFSTTSTYIDNTTGITVPIISLQQPLSKVLQQPLQPLPRLLKPKPHSISPPKTSFYIDCSSPTAEATDPRCVYIKAHWEDRNTTLSTIVPDDMCPTLRYVYLKDERLWFKCCAPPDYAIEDSSSGMIKLTFDTPAFSLNALRDKINQTAQGGSMMMMNSTFGAMKGLMGFKNFLFSLSSMFSLGGIKMMAAKLKALKKTMIDMVFLKKNPIWDDMPKALERMEFVNNMNRLTCKGPLTIVNKVVGDGKHIRNAYIDSTVEICFQKAGAGVTGRGIGSNLDSTEDGKTSSINQSSKAFSESESGDGGMKFNIVAPTECINIGTKKNPSNVLEAEMERKVNGRKKKYYSMVGNMNAYGHGPSKRRYEVTFL